MNKQLYIEELLRDYNKRKYEIKHKLREFKRDDDKKYIEELLFCILTPASNAKKCWQAVQLIGKEKKIDRKKVREILRKHTRFYNNKTERIMNAFKECPEIKKMLENDDRKELRNFLAEEVEGYGLKEASHFLRNIGKSDNQIAILDRHILRNLKKLGLIEDDYIKSRNDYFKIEEKFIAFSDKIGIPADELDLLFWSRETGEVFK